MSSNLQISIKNNERVLRKSRKTLKLILISDPNYITNFLEHAKKLYNEIRKPLRKVDNYCNIIPNLKNYWFDKTLT